MITRLPRIKFGITAIDDALEKYAQGIERAMNVTVGGGLSMSTGPTGTRIYGRDPEKRMTVNLTASVGGGGYSAEEVQPATAGTWTVVTGGWTGTVYEANGNASVPISPHYYVEVTYETFSDDWRFQAGNCP